MIPDVGVPTSVKLGLLGDPNFVRSHAVPMPCACAPSPSFSWAVVLAGSTRSATSSVTWAEAASGSGGRHRTGPDHLALGWRAAGKELATDPHPNPCVGGSHNPPLPLRGADACSRRLATSSEVGNVLASMCRGGGGAVGV